MNQIRKPIIGLLISLILLAVCPAWADSSLETDILYKDLHQRFTETPPPPTQVRPIAEFEPASDVIIRYPLGIPVSLVAQLSNTADVICIVSSASVQNQATSAFNSAGVNMANVSFMIAATDSYWTRDYGPWFIIDGNGIYSVVDFQYNRPRPNDNMIPQLFAQQQSINYYGMNLQQTGGNYMTDGINTAAQTQIAYTENSGLGQTGVNLKMQNYLGITNYYVIQDPNNTYIDHIDCWGKFLAPDKVLIRSVPTSHAQYDEIEQVASFFANQNCAWGYPYKVYRVYTPQNQPYTNSLILNKKVFVPIMNNTNDAAALAVYRQALPGYTVVGIAGSSSAPWESTDALHCRTHEVPDEDMLYIGHYPVFGTQQDSNIDITATIRPFSGSPVYSDSVFVCYKVNQGEWQRSSLINISGYDYTTTITGFAPGDSVRYFIHAADQSGKANDHPLTGAYDTHLFVMAPDSVPPTVTHEPIGSISNLSDSIQFIATVSDNLGVSQVFFRYKIDEGQMYEFPMEFIGNDTWIYTYVPEFNQYDNFFKYQFRAMDNSNPSNQTIYPAINEWISAQLDYVANDDALNPMIDFSIANVYPNPFNTGSSDKISILVNGKKASQVQVQLFNLRGQSIGSMMTTLSNDGISKIDFRLDERALNSLPVGVYFLRVRFDAEIHTRKIVIGF